MSEYLFRNQNLQMKIPKQQKNHGLKKSEISFNSLSINNIIRSFTREAGVRNLEKEIAKIDFDSAINFAGISFWFKHISSN